MDPGGKTDCVTVHEDAVFKEIEEETGLQEQELEFANDRPIITYDLRPKYYFVFEV